jgi:4,5-DOPA dioxygenase extradiol
MEQMPVMFVGHGSPENAMEENDFTRTWHRLGREMPRPRAVLCVSAHWFPRRVAVSVARRPRTMHDFHGFPDELYDITYSPPRWPEAAERVAALTPGMALEMDEERGLDHGAWAVLSRMYPDADVPVAQLSIDRERYPSFHYQMGKQLAPLREEGVLIIGSGNMVHNPRLADRGMEDGYAWAERFDEVLAERIQAGDHASLMSYEELGEEAALAVPSEDHYLPLLYVLGAASPWDRIRFFNERVVMGSVSMRGVLMG